VYVKYIREYSNPYYLSVKNTNGLVQRAVLYGFNDKLHSQNYGSGNGVIIESQSDNPYLRHLSNSAYSPFEIKRIIIEGNKEEVYEMCLSIYSADANGQSCCVPISVKQNIDDSITSFLSDERIRVQMNYPIKIDGNTFISFFAKPNSETNMYIYYQKENYKLMRFYRHLTNKLAGRKYVTKSDGITIKNKSK